MSISNKHKEIIKKAIESVTREDGLIEIGKYDEEIIVEMLSSALTEQLEEIERWVKEHRLKNENAIDKLEEVDERARITNRLNENLQMGYQIALSDTLSHIREQKELIKKQ